LLLRACGSHLNSVADAAVASVPSVEHVVVVPRAGDALEVPWTEGRDVLWACPGEDPHETAPRHRHPETPYMIIYTSGPHGRPKGAVHVHGGFPIKAAQDLAHTFDLTER